MTKAMYNEDGVTLCFYDDGRRVLITCLKLYSSIKRPPRLIWLIL